MPDRPALECTLEDIFSFSIEEDRKFDREAKEVAAYAETLPESVRGFRMFGVWWVRPERRDRDA